MLIERVDEFHVLLSLNARDLRAAVCAFESYSAGLHRHPAPHLLERADYFETVAAALGVAGTLMQRGGDQTPEFVRAGQPDPAAD